MRNALKLVLDKHNRDAEDSQPITGLGWALIIGVCILGSVATGGAALPFLGPTATALGSAGRVLWILR
ncbi:hypothetical protein QBC44DRAFT_364087 [Cladorrhinum sp. PSN332]|nr:hypothetical protein QBC44DRAFT_364087 [Cladorrhinum sp. PSN332]